MEKKIYIAIEISSEDGIMQCQLFSTLKDARKALALWYGQTKQEVWDELDTFWIEKDCRYIYCYDRHFEYHVLERTV